MSNYRYNKDTDPMTEIEVFDPDHKGKNLNKGNNEDKKYMIYPNTDLRYKNNRSVDIEKLIKYNPHIPELRVENMDTIEFRFRECKKNRFIYLDLSNLGLTEMPSKLPKELKQLFISDNNLNNLGDLRYLTKLEVLDACNNKLSNLPKLSDTIEEIVCRNNNLSNINHLVEFSNLKRLDLSYNKIQEIPNISMLEILTCSHNILVRIHPMRNLKKLNVRNNYIKFICKFPNLKELDAEKNNISKIDELPLLSELYANDNKLDNIKNLHNITVLHIKNNQVTKLPYFKDLNELVGDHSRLKQLSQEYKIQDIEVFKDNTIRFVFKIAK